MPNRRIIPDNRETRRRPKTKWSDAELTTLKNLYPDASVDTLIRAFPTCSWASLQGRARTLGLHRPTPALLSSTLNREGDIGFCAGMIIADGCILETCISSGGARSVHEGGTLRPIRFYSIPQVKISMEDKESIDRVAQLWGRSTTLCQKSSTGNNVWSAQVGGRKALDLMQSILPYLSGPKKKKAIYLMTKYAGRKTLPVERREKFKPFGDLR